MIRSVLYVFFIITIIISCQKTSVESIPNEEAIIETPPIDFDLDKIIKRGVLIGIIENSTTGYFIYKGQTLGYEYELLQNLAEYLEVDLELKLTSNLKESMEMLNRGDGDIVAFPLTVTKQRKKLVLFTDYQYTIRMMLVQRLPDDPDLKAHEIERSLLRNQVELIGVEVHVRYRSSYLTRLKNLSEEIGGDIVIIEEGEHLETEDMVRKVSEGEFMYTIADEDIAMVNATYYDNIDVATPISFPTQIAWAVRLNSQNLHSTINIWQKKIKREPTFNVIYNKYFKNEKASLNRKKSEFFSEGGGEISEYDVQIKEGANKLGWDWRLLSSQVYQESKFNPNAKSWVGAVGLLQIMPSTGKEFGATDLLDPNQNIVVAVKYIEWLDNYWSPKIEDEETRTKFILASYNVGQGHVLDAMALADKFGSDKNIWEGNVEKYLHLKSKPKYYNDPVVKYGYCRGEEPVKYVKEIYTRYDNYIQMFPADSLSIDQSGSKETI